MRDTNETIQWYRDHEVFPSELSFDPDGMCLKICRVARGLPAVFPSAISAQEATPVQHRVHRVRDLRRGMVLYFDEAGDSNPFGHVVTMVGRVKDGNPNLLRDVLVRTNSVKSNRIVVTRGNYFSRKWGDSFQFGATWLNGAELDVPGVQPRPTPPPLGSARNLKAAIADLQKAVEWHKQRGHDRLVKALQRDIQEIQNTIKEFS